MNFLEMLKLLKKIKNDLIGTGKPGRCFICGEPGHWKGECPQKRKGKGPGSFGGKTSKSGGGFGGGPFGGKKTWSFMSLVAGLFSGATPTEVLTSTEPLKVALGEEPLSVSIYEAEDRDELDFTNWLGLPIVVPS